jgi:hypothetical protein
MRKPGRASLVLELIRLGTTLKQWAIQTGYRGENPRCRGGCVNRPLFDGKQTV